MRRSSRYGFAVLAFALAVSASAANHVDTSRRGKIVITVPIDLLNGEDDIAARWNRAIRDYWNKDPQGRRFEFCGKLVEFEPKIQPIAAGQRGRPDAHKIRMMLVPDDTVGRSNVSWNGPFDPKRNFTGTWVYNAPDVVIAHEFGHLVGIPDEYFHLDEPGEGNQDDVRDALEETRPLPECRDSLMGTSAGLILKRHINEVMRQHGVTGCEEWIGWMDMTITASTIRMNIRMNITLKHDGRGNLTGEMDGEVPFVKTGGIPCEMKVIRPEKVSATLLGQYTAPQRVMSLTTSETRSEQGTYSLECPGFRTTAKYGETGQGSAFSDPVVERLLRNLTVGSAGSVNASDEGPLAASPEARIKAEISLRLVEE